MDGGRNLRWAKDARPPAFVCSASQPRTCLGAPSALGQAIIRDIVAGVCVRDFWATWNLDSHDTQCPSLRYKQQSPESWPRHPLSRWTRRRLARTLHISLKWPVAVACNACSRLHRSLCSLQTLSLPPRRGTVPAIEQGMAYTGAFTCPTTLRVRLNRPCQLPPMQPTEALISVLASQLHGTQCTSTKGPIRPSAAV